jgi:leucine-zipper of insertion element IS481
MPWKKIEPMEERIEFALKAMGTLNFRALCQEYGISAKTGYKWKERFLREGIRGMEEQSRRPQSHAKQLAEEEVCEIMRLKLAHMPWGPETSNNVINYLHTPCLQSSKLFRSKLPTSWRRHLESSSLPKLICQKAPSRTKFICSRCDWDQPHSQDGCATPPTCRSTSLRD